MLCINHSSTDIYFNLAAEEYLLKNFKENVLMIWQNEPSVVIGKYQQVVVEANLEFAREHLIKIARRMTGGGAVYHDLGNLNITYIEQDTRGNYAEFTNQLLAFLQLFVPEIQSDERNNLFINGFKISGSAQCVHKNKSLHHCTLLYSSDLNCLNTVLQGSVGQSVGKTIKGVQSIHSQVTNLSEYLSEDMNLYEFRRNLLEYFFDLYPGNIFYTFTENDLENIRRLKEEKYASAKWISV